MMRSRTLYMIIQLLAVLVMMAGCAKVEIPETVAEIRPGILQGYLPADAYPNSLALIPPPPAEGSAAMALDEEISKETLLMQGSPRWALATDDAALAFPKAAELFSCALDIDITEKNTPHTYMLLRRTLADAGLSTYSAKNNYKRTRPFVLNKKPTCTPHEEELLKNDGSYPSGHTAVGMAWALILTELLPEQTDAILERGRAFGESRVICNVHWQSDVNEGRFIGAAAVARLHGDPVFLAEMEAAKRELAAARENGLKSTRDCKAEAEALSYWSR